MKIFFRGRWYRPKRFGRRWRIRVGRRTCRVIRRGRSWRVWYGKRWIITRKFQFRVGRTYRTVTRRGRFYSMRFKRRTVKFRFYRRRYFKFKGRRIFIRRSKRIGRRRYYKFKVKGILISRRRRFRRRRRIRCKCTLSYGGGFRLGGLGGLGSNNDGESSENVTIIKTSLFFQTCRDYSASCKISIVGKFP